MPCPESLSGMSLAPSLAMGATVEHMVGRKVCICSFWAPKGVHASHTRRSPEATYAYFTAHHVLHCCSHGMVRCKGTSLAITQGKTSPAAALYPMFRVPTVLLRVPSGAPPTVILIFSPQPPGDHDLRSPPIPASGRDHDPRSQPPSCGSAPIPDLL